MKRKLSALSQRYDTALRKHMQQRSRTDVEAARGLGSRALAMGLETLDMARIHQGALAGLEPVSRKDGFVKRASLFFMEAIAPIEEAHGAAMKTSAQLNRLNKALDRRTLDLVASSLSLKTRTAQRKRAQAALKRTGEHYETLLKESLALQKHLQHLTHRILSAHEDKRKEIGEDLQNEIVQTLLGINVRLLTVRKAASQHLQKELAGTQRLVISSKKTIERFSRDYRELQEP